MNGVVAWNRSERISVRMRVKLQVTLGVLVLMIIAALPVFHLLKSRRDAHDYWGILQALIYLEEVKKEGALSLRLSNGYAITLRETEVADWKHLPDGERLSGDGKSIESEQGCVYILGPVGMPVKARFQRELAGIPAGTEIAAPYALVLSKLYLINRFKIKAAKDHSWEKGRSVTLDELVAVEGLYKRQFEDSWVAFDVNPVGVLPRARITRSHEGLPAGLEITLEGSPN